MLYVSISRVPGLSVGDSVLTCYITQVHIQQIGQRELKRAPALAKRTAEIKRREKALFEKHGVKL